MFADAYELASKFAQPLVVSARLQDGTVQSSVGTFVILNRDGWVLTAAHLVEVLRAHQQHSKRIAEYEQRQAALEAAQSKNEAEARRLRELSQVTKPNPKWITNCALWWGRDGITHSEIVGFPAADLAAVRLEPFEPDQVEAYPVMKDPSKLRFGTSLCRLGFPFHSVATSFDETTGGFTIDSSAIPFPRFPIEGIYTRNVILRKADDTELGVKFLETSSPGLRGQSGGPVFDTEGTVWAIQAKTKHLDLGFKPTIETEDGKQIEESQFLSVGWGVHPDTITAFLRDNDIAFQLSDY